MLPGFDPVSLAAFTALAPAGAIAVIVLAIMLLADSSIDDACRQRMNHLLAIPLFVSWAGFIASATHLGTPANALYVFSRVGASPLSNEVTSVIAFLFVLGVFWLFSFRRHFPFAIQKAFLVLCIVTAVCMVLFMGFAYNVDTVPTWHTKFSPFNLALLGVLGGISLSIGVLDLSAYPGQAKVGRLFVAALALLFVAGAVLAFYVHYLGAFANNVRVLADQLPQMWITVALFVFIVGIGLTLQWGALSRLNGTKRSVGICLGCVVVFAGIFFARILFYAAYLSVGF